MSIHQYLTRTRSILLSIQRILTILLKVCDLLFIDTLYLVLQDFWAFSILLPNAGKSSILLSIHQYLTRTRSILLSIQRILTILLKVCDLLFIDTLNIVWQGFWGIFFVDVDPVNVFRLACDEGIPYASKRFSQDKKSASRICMYASHTDGWLLERPSAHPAALLTSDLFVSRLGTHLHFHCINWDELQEHVRDGVNPNMEFFWQLTNYHIS